MAENGKKPRKKKEAVDPNETPENRFKRLGVMRVQTAVVAIERVGKLTGRGYASTPEQRAKILAALNGALANVKAVLEGTSTPGGTFNLE